MLGGKPVPCGKCYACQSNRRNSWTFRLLKESQYSVSSYFIGLSYEDGKTDGNVYKETCQLWLKRMRKALYPIRFKYYLVSEYGETTFRPHYHCLIFFREIVSINRITDVVQKTWNRGFVDIGLCEQASIHYCTHHHISKGYHPDGLNPTFTLMSRRPAIGFDYISRSGSFHIGNPELSYVTFEGGFKTVIPRYYKNKLYTEEERKIIAENAKPKDFVDRVDYFKKNPTHSRQQYVDYLKQWKEKQLSLSIKKRLNKKL